MERIAMEAQVNMTTQMIALCREKTLSSKHSSDQLSESEKSQFQNCIMKYMEAPNHIMGAVNNQMGGPGGF